MDIESILDWAFENLYLAIGIAVFTIFIIFRVWKTARLYLGNKKYVKKSAKLRRKKFNGTTLVDKITKKRKKGTNSYSKLKGRGKKLTKKYLHYKVEELPIITKFSYGKLFKRSNDKLIIYVKNERKRVMKLKLKKGFKELVKLSNKYECIDELILFLHNLPDAIIEQEEYDIFLPDFDVSIGYKIK